ncbi:MAG: hypothetical protein HC880_14325 [Bacteroidia bacterium]|nr:hypothetical protein [Bacteroidia bacterium]
MTPIAITKTTIKGSIEIILDNDYVTLIYKNDLKALEVLWKKFTPSKHYFEILQVAYRAAASHPVKYWISDMTNAGVISLENQKWIKKELIPRLLKGGVEKIGVVVSLDIFNKMFTDELRKILGHQVCKYFYSLPEAENWARKEVQKL